MPSQRSYVYLNGRYVSPDKARISLFDRGFLLGDAIFETLRVIRSVPLFIDEHLERLKQSGDALGYNTGDVSRQLSDMIPKLLNRNRLRDASVRITVSGGKYKRGLSRDRHATPTVSAFALPFSGYTPKEYKRGIRLLFDGDTAFSPAKEQVHFKSNNYLANIVAYSKVENGEADEVLMQSPAGLLSECTNSNFFFISGGVLRTPAVASGILPGITRGKVIGLARVGGIKVKEGRFKPGDLKGCREAFVTNSLKGIMPVTLLNNRKIGKGTPGKITLELMRTYNILIKGFLQ